MDGLRLETPINLQLCEVTGHDRHAPICTFNR